jgi:hypothetical protein
VKETPDATEANTRIVRFQTHPITRDATFPQNINASFLYVNSIQLNCLFIHLLTQQPKGQL